MTINADKPKVAAIVVTYNRKKLLQECLEAILAQSYPVTHCILIDNASTDGTKDMLEEEGYLSNPVLHYHPMEKNLGGSGGFYEGIRIARDEYNDSIDWLLIMDDDTILMEDSLEELIHSIDVIQSSRGHMLKNGDSTLHSDRQSRPISFLASNVFGPEGEFMNVPVISRNTADNGYAYWYELLSKGIVGIDTATFVSILVSMDAVKKCGLPCRDYFIWGDDSEYTQRLSKFYGDAFFVGSSQVIHKRFGAKALSLDNTDDPARIRNYFYLFRNNAVNEKIYHGRKLFGLWCFYQALKSIKYLRKPHGKPKMKAMASGYLAAISQYKRFKDYIEGQIADT